MEIILFIGIQATGKSTFFKERFADTHVRINRDMLKSAGREWQLFETCVEMRQACVIDAMNLTPSKRARFIAAAKTIHTSVKGYYFCSKLSDALLRNSARKGATRIPDKGVMGASGQLILPTTNEGFDKLYYVRLTEAGFEVEPWKNNSPHPTNETRIP